MRYYAPLNSIFISSKNKLIGEISEGVVNFIYITRLNLSKLFEYQVKFKVDLLNPSTLSLF